MNARTLVFVAVVFSLVGRWEADAHSAVEPAPRIDRGWVVRQELLNKRTVEAAEKARLIFIGDSITEGWEKEGKDVWAKYYAPRNAVNLGIGGDRTQHVLWRLDHGNIDGLKPKAAVLMIGTNNSNFEDNTPEQIADGIRAIVKKLREKLPSTKILLLAVFPRSENFSAQRGKLAMINQVIRRVADEKDVFWVDFGHKFLTDQGTIPQELMYDFLHLTPKGYQVWADAIEPMLSRILEEKSVAQADVAGEWIATMPQPEGDPVEVNLTLKLDGGVLTGNFRRGEDESRTLQIKEASLTGNEFKWTVVRERSSGETMTYKMSGRVEDGKIKGQAVTESGGETRTIEWVARRK